MVDITSLKVRLARLRLASELDDGRNQRFRHMAPKEGEWEIVENEYERQRDKERGKRDTPRTGKSPTQQNTGGKRKKNNKLTRSDQKRGKKDNDKVKGSHSGRNKRQEGSTQEYSGFGEYVKNTGDRRKKKNKLTRSDKKRP